MPIRDRDTGSDEDPIRTTLSRDELRWNEYRVRRGASQEYASTGRLGGTNG